MPASTGSSRSSSAKPSATATPRPHEANLFDLQAKYAEVVGLEWAREYLKRIADSG